MRKKILVPIMALAMIVAAGVNYGMISSSINSNVISIASLVKVSSAIAEQAPGGEKDSTGMKQDYVKDKDGNFVAGGCPTQGGPC